MKILRGVRASYFWERKYVVQCRWDVDLAAYRWYLTLLKQKRIREGMA